MKKAGATPNWYRVWYSHPGTNLGLLIHLLEIIFIHKQFILEKTRFHIVSVSNQNIALLTETFTINMT